MRDSTEDYCLFEAFAVGHGGHAVVAQSEQSLGEGRVLHVDPSLLIEQEKMDVIQEWRAQVDANIIISSSHDQKSLIKWQESHGVPSSSARRLTCLLDLLPLNRHDLAIDTVGLEVLELAHKLSVGVLTTKEVDSIEDSIRQSCHF